MVRTIRDAELATGAMLCEMVNGKCTCWNKPHCTFRGFFVLDYCKSTVNGLRHRVNSRKRAKGDSPGYEITAGRVGEPGIFFIPLFAELAETERDSPLTAVVDTIKTYHAVCHIDLVFLRINT